jgi:acetyltransferase-like isoleucine patch superfamily enzyme
MANLKSALIHFRDMLFPEAALKIKRRYLIAEMNDSVTIYSCTIVINNSKDKSRIRIGSGSHVAGLLQVFDNCGEIKIGEECYIGEGTRLLAAKRIVLGDHVQLAQNINIFDSNVHSLDPRERQLEFTTNLTKGQIKLHDLKEQEVVIGDNVWIGAGSIILKGVTIGENTIVGAGSVVVKSLPANVMAAGNPARIIKQLEIKNQGTTGTV